MRIAIYGYGNLGKAVELNSALHDDIELTGVFTRRNPETVKTCGAKIYSASEIENFKDKIDVLIIGGGSATDLPVMSPALAKNFNIVDSFDTHAKMKEHWNNVNNSALENKHTALIAAGWDPGLFSLARIYTESIVPEGNTYTFWGTGVSQGHSDAIRRIKGVKNGKQYTVPNEEVYSEVLKGTKLFADAKQMHNRVCYVVAEEGADKARIENEIKTMPNYFEGYDTTVNFISEEEFKENHSGMPHGGSVIRSARSKSGDLHVVEFRLKLSSNPEFTSSVLLAYSRAVYRLYKEGNYGCKTVFDIAPKYLSDRSYEDLISHTL